MDFNSLIHVAQKNDQAPKNEIKYYSTKFEPPKKEQRTKSLSDNIKKFLARKEAEEKKKVKEAKEKKEELLALRSQDKKATRRVNVMLKRTKSANKSVLDDAVDRDNTAVTLAGPSQPDEDDYGYVSQEASAFYNKMMQKYSSMPEEPKIFTSAKKNSNVNLSSTKDRVRAALLKEQEEALLPKPRKRRTKQEIEEDRLNGGSSHKENQERREEKDRDRDREREQERERERERDKEKEKSKPKSSKPAPPPLNFQDLLKLAEKKQFEPIKIEPKKKSEEEEHPMTKRQKREMEKEKERLEQKEKRRQAENEGKKPESSKCMPPPNKIPKLSSNGIKPPTSKPEPSKKPDQNGYKPSKPDQNGYKPSKPDQNGYRPSRPDSNGYKSSKPDSRPDRSPKSDPNRRPDVNKSKLRAELEKPRDPKPQSSNRPSQPTQKPSRPPDMKKAVRREDEINKAKSSVSNMKPRDKIPEKGRPQLDGKATKGSLDVRPKQFPPADVRPRQFPPADVRPKQFPPPDVRPKQFPPGDVRRRPPPKKQPMGHKRRILDDDDSEYDSEMDDFIDDGPEEGEDYSKYISEIFGYDKNKYRDIPEEDDRMESSFSQMMREEFISSKIGLMEDLEDMKQEALEKKEKAARKKAMMRR